MGTGLIDTLYTDCEGYLEFRALDANRKGNVVCEYFRLDDMAGMKSWIDKYLGRYNLYFGVATRDGKGGSKENLVSIPGLHCDIDFKDIEQSEADKLIEQFPLKPTATVNSGNGYHLYWKFKEPLGQEDISSVERALWGLASVLRGDFASAEAARILRIPKTRNLKYKPPRRVELLHCNGDEYSLSDFDFLPEPDTNAEPKITKKDQTEALDRVMQCAFMQMCRDKASSLEEPAWYAMVSNLAREQGGRALIHRLSKPYRKYSAKETDAKILHAVESSGPMTCDKIKQIWNCGQSCGVTSPAVLARKEVSGVSNGKHGKRGKQLEAEVSNGKQEVSRSKQDSTTSQILCNSPENLALEVRAWVEECPGKFNVSDIDKEFGLLTREQKNNRSKILNQLLNDGIIERIGTVRGNYQIVDKTLEEIDFLNCDEGSYGIRLPFELDSMVRIMPGNIIVVAGEQNAGKTALLLWVVLYNLDNKRVSYFSSEMGPAELRDRLKLFDVPLEKWKFKAYERTENFHQVLDPDGLNIIDFLEVHDEFYKIGGCLRQIHDKLRNGIAIVAIQKSKGSDMGRGGSMGLEKPRLYLALSADPPNDSTIKIVKAKNYIDQNCNGKERDFRLLGGWCFQPTTPWRWVKKGGK